MRASSGSSHSTDLRIRDGPVEGSESGQMGGEFDQVPLGGPPSPFGKGKGKVSNIRYPGGSEYLTAAIQNVEVVGPSRVEPSFGKTFAARYGPPFGAPTYSLPMLSKCRRWFASLRRLSRTTFISLCTPLLKGSCSTLTYVPLSFLPTSGVFW